MLYISTRNLVDTFTAYRALQESRAPDGGFYVPFHLTAFTEEELMAVKAQSPFETVAQILNCFFGTHLNGWDVECAIGRSALKLETVGHRLAIAEVWRNPEGAFSYTIKSLYSLMGGKKRNEAEISGWAYIAIEVALLFGMYSAMEDVPQDGFDMAVTTEEFADAVAILFAREMGLPINTIIFACGENSTFWDFINRGEYNTRIAEEKPTYMEYFLFKILGIDEAKRYLDASEKKSIYYIDELQLEILNSGFFAAVVSRGRVDTVISSLLKTNNYRIDPAAALSYSGLQDYRACTGVSRYTLLLAKERMQRTKE